MEVKLCDHVPLSALKHYLLNCGLLQINGTLAGLRAHLSLSSPPGPEARPVEAAGSLAAAKGWRAKHPVVRYACAKGRGQGPGGSGVGNTNSLHLDYS